MDKPELPYMTLKELRKTVGAMRKEGCPAVSKLGREELLAEMAKYSAGIKARNKAKPVDMKPKSAKAKKEEKKEVPVATTKEKAEKLTMFSNPMIHPMFAKKSAAVAKAAQKIEHTPAVVEAIAKGDVAKAKKEAKKVAKKEGVPAAVAAEVVEHVKEVEKPKSKGSDNIEEEVLAYTYNPMVPGAKFKGMEPMDALRLFIKQGKSGKPDMDLGMFIAENFQAERALTMDMEDLEMAILDMEDQIENFDLSPSAKDKMKATLAKYRKIYASRKGGAKQADKPKKEKAKKAAVHPLFEKKAEAKTKRPASAYAIAVGKYMKQGMKMAEAAAAAKKELGK